jgi:hypothetical protein
MKSLGLKSKAASKLVSSFEDGQEGALVNVEAEEKCGKNHFAFTAAKPIVCISVDRDARPVARKFDGVHVARFDFEVPVGKAAKPQHVSDMVRPVWKEIDDLFFDALKSKNVRTIVMDTGTRLWDIIRLAKFGKLQQVPPILYTQVNALFERMILAGQGAGKNVIWLHRLGEKWIDVKKKGKIVSANTGEMKRLGFKGMGFDVEANIRLTRDGNVFTATIVDNGFDADFNGMQFKKKMCTYPAVMSALTDTDPEQW